MLFQGVSEAELHTFLSCGEYLSDRMQAECWTGLYTFGRKVKLSVYLQTVGDLIKAGVMSPYAYRFFCDRDDPFGHKRARARDELMRTRARLHDLAQLASY